jgi:RHS repeat-associated protein
MGTSSARPDDLDRFASRSRNADDALRDHSRRLRSTYADFQSGTEWGVLDIHSMLAGFGTFIEYNEIDARWVARIADAFRRAGGNGSVKTLPDAAIHASLRAAGLLGGRQSVTFDDPVAYGMPPTTGYANDPVNTASGNFVELEHDLPSFSRMYNSRSDRSGAFGTGWSSWADARLHPRADGAEYIGPDGQRALFPRMGEGYGRVLGVSGLVEPGPRGLVLKWFGGERWEFDEAGLPVRVSKGPGTDLLFTHEDGRLAELRHRGGKALRVHWRNDRIEALECSDGRDVEYRYDDGELVDAGGRHYEVGEGKVLSVTDADGVVEVANAYDEEGRVLRQLSPFGRNTVFGYLPGQVTVASDDNDGPTNVYVHDTVGRLLSLIVGDETRVSFAYDSWGNPVAVTDRKGAVTVQEWDERSNLKRRVLPTGVEFTFTHDSADRILEVTASTGGSFKHSYEGDERSPSELIDAEGGVTRLTVRDGLVREIEDPDGVKLSFDFDADGNLVSATDAEGNTARLERDGAGRVTAAVSALGRRTTFAHDARGRVIERRAPDGAVWRYEYSPAGRVTAVIDPSGAREEMRYGEHGQLEQSSDALGQLTTLGYDFLGNHVETVAADGAAWRFAYDAVCRLTAITDPTGATTIREYDAGGNLTASVDPIGTRYQAAFDEHNRVTLLSDGLTAASFEYDALGRCLAQRRPDGAFARAEYDRLGRRTATTDPLGGTSRVEYTPAGRVRAITEPSGRTTTYEYDVCGRLAAQIDGAGRRWEFRYDADGAVVETIAPSGERERFGYDAAGRLVERYAPGAGLTLYAYDERGLVVAVTDRESGTRRFEYDAAGRVVAAIDANRAATRFSYDVRGRISEVRDPLGGTVSREYDTAGRLVRETDQLGRAMTWDYDAAGRLVAREDGAGRRREWTYDEAGRVRTFGAAGERPVTITRDALGREVAIEEPSGRTHAMTWDAAGRLVERRRDALALRYGYDEDGRRAFIGYPDGTSTEYRYDSGGLLECLSHPATGPIVFERDASGRIVSARGAGLNARWEYEGGELVGYGSTRLERDADGRLVAIDGTRLAYDAAGQLIAAGDETFAYDACGRLVGDGEAYDAAGQRTDLTYDGSGRRTDRFRWDALGHLAAAGDTRVSVDALGELASVDDADVLWDTADPFSPLAWVDGRAVIGQWATAGPDGVEWLDADWQATVGGPRDAFGAPASAHLRLGYRGELEFAGLTWLRARAYDPVTRGFLSPDPLAPVVGTAYAANTYHYAGNDPFGRVDPLGLRPVSEQELREIRDRMGSNFVARNADYIVAGVLIVGGIAVMATGVGGPIGAAMIGGALLSAGASAGIQKVTTGSVDYGEVAVAGLVGAAAGGAGAWAGSARALATASPLLRGTAVGVTEGVTGGALNRGIHGRNPFDPAGMATDVLTGGVAGGVGWRLGRNRPEVWYRGMSADELASVTANRGVTVRGMENFVTQDRAYIQSLINKSDTGTYDNIVRFETRPGTHDALVDVGGTSRSNLIDNHPVYGELPRIERGNTHQVHIKGEGQSVNFGLRPDSVDIFNDRIQGISR